MKILQFFRITPYQITEPKCLQQNNGYDCGIHVLAQCEHLANFASRDRRIEGCPPLDRETVQLKRKDILNLINVLRKPRV